MNARMEDLPDERLVEHAKRGEGYAYSVLVGRYRDKIYHTIFRFTRNHSDTDDLAQETFMYAFKALRNFRQSSSFYTWIYRIAVNVTLNFLKKKKSEQVREGFVEKYGRMKEFYHSSSSPEYRTLRKELREKLQEAIHSLPDAYKSSFVLVVFQGMSHAQAAQVLRCSENTVSWRMHKARKMIQDKLKPYLRGGQDEM